MLERIERAFSQNGWETRNLCEHFARIKKATTRTGMPGSEWVLAQLPALEAARTGLPDAVSIHCLYPNGTSWWARLNSHPSEAGQVALCPLAALRRAYASSDSRRARSALRPVLVALREPPEQRWEQHNALLREPLFPPEEVTDATAAWASCWFGVVEALGELAIDPADYSLLALDTVRKCVGDAPDEIRARVATFRAGLEEMG